MNLPLNFSLSRPIDRPIHWPGRKALLRLAGIACSLPLLSLPAFGADKILPHPQIEMVTTEGTVKLELDYREAPRTVEHFVELVDAGFFNGLIFHRVIAGFMVQGGGYTPGFKPREDKETIVNESGNALSNVRGTIAMARTNDPHSANSQFFVNVVDNQRLDPQKGGSRGRWGYTVFGYVTEGMDVIDKIAAAETAPQGQFPNAPVIPIVIKSMSRAGLD